MKLSVSENADPNYLGTIIRIGEITNHPGADKLELTEVFGNTVVLGKQLYTIGDICAYFPVESCLSPKFLSWANLYDKPELNADGKSKSFFSQKGNRVKAIKLRGIPSQGFLYKVSELAKYYNTSEKDFPVGESFDMVGNDQLVTKYVRPDRKTQGENTQKNKIPKWINTTMGVVPRSVRKILFPPIKWYYGLSKDDGIKSLIVDGQFRQHYKTENFYKNSWLLQPDDDITITSKIHGTSFCAGNVLCKRNLGLCERVLSYFGLDIPKTEYKLVYSSRNILQNRRDGKYTDNLYGKHAEIIEGRLPKGVEIFGEILGWASANKTIQSQYDYGVVKGESELWVYRVGKVDERGNYYEFTWDEIESLCQEIGLKTVPVYFKGKAKDLFLDILVEEGWCDNWMKRVKEKYLDKTCEYCTTGVVNEGVVIKINNRELKPVFKYKSSNFLIKESEERDRDESNIEEEN